MIRDENGIKRQFMGILFQNERGFLYGKEK